MQNGRIVNSSYASRTMYWSGPILLAFVIYHLLHLTAGFVHPGSDFIEGDVYHNVVAGFSGLVCVRLVHLFDDSAGIPHPAWGLEHVPIGRHSITRGTLRYSRKPPQCLRGHYRARLHLYSSEHRSRPGDSDATLTRRFLPVRLKKHGTRRALK